MKLDEFYRKYGNTPLGLRFTPISYKDGGDMTLSGVYQEITRLRDKISPDEIEIKRLLNLASIFYEAMDKLKKKKLES